MVRLGAHQPAPREPFSSRHSSRDSDDSALPWQLLLSKAGGHLQQAVQERRLPVDKEQQVRTEVQDSCGHAPELEGRLLPQDPGRLDWWHRLVAHIWNLTIQDVEVGRLQVPGQLESQSYPQHTQKMAQGASASPMPPTAASQASILQSGLTPQARASA